MRPYHKSSYVGGIAFGLVFIGIIFGFKGVVIAVSIIIFLMYRAFKR